MDSLGLAFTVFKKASFLSPLFDNAPAHKVDYLADLEQYESSVRIGAAAYLSVTATTFDNVRMISIPFEMAGVAMHTSPIVFLPSSSNLGPALMT
jgi:hypothetical protein